MTAATTPSITSRPPEGAVHVQWVMPEGFFELPLAAESLEEHAKQLLDLAKEVLPQGTEDMHVEWAIMCTASYDMLYEAGVQYAGFVMTEVEGNRCLANINVSMVDASADALTDPIGATTAALRALDLGEVTEFALPCGPAVSCIGSRQATVDAALTASGSDESFWTSFIQVHIPMPNETVVVMEMSTPSMEGWEVFSSMFAGITLSVRYFDNDGKVLGPAAV